MTTRFVSAPDEVRIAYEVTGTGPAVMLVHGAGKTRQSWVKSGYVARLEPDFTVINVDLRGCGQSERRTQIEDYAVEKLCADLEAVLDDCEVERCAVWGYSLGANVGRYLAAWSGRVSRLVAVGIPFGPAVDAAFDRYIDSFVAEWEPQVAEGAVRKRGGQKTAAVPPMIPVWLALFQAMRGWPEVGLDEIACPTLLVIGKRNASAADWAQANQAELARRGIKVEWLAGLDHQQEFSRLSCSYQPAAEFLGVSPLGI